MLTISRNIISGEGVLTKLIKNTHEPLIELEIEKLANSEVRAAKDSSNSISILGVEINPNTNREENSCFSVENIKNSISFQEESKDEFQRMSKERIQVNELKTIIAYFENSLIKLKSDLSLAEQNLEMSDDVLNPQHHLPTKRQKIDGENEEIKVVSNNKDINSESMFIKRRRGRKCKRSMSNAQKSKQEQKNSESQIKGSEKPKNNDALPPSWLNLFMNENNVDEAKKIQNNKVCIEQILNAKNSKNSKALSSFLV